MNLVGVRPSDVVRLEDVGVQRKRHGMSSETAVIGDGGFVAQHGPSIDDGVAPDVTVATEDRAADDGFLTDARVRPHDRALDRGVFFDVALAPDNAVRADARSRLDD